jgi:hypothetical protein
MVTSKEAIPISGNFTFQVSPSSRFAGNDFYNAYLRLFFERTFTYTNSGAVNEPIKVVSQVQYQIIH